MARNGYSFTQFFYFFFRLSYNVAQFYTNTTVLITRESFAAVSNLKETIRPEVQILITLHR